MAESAHALDASAPPGWTLAFRTSDLIAWYKETPQVNARALLAVGDFDAPPEVVFNLVSDVESFTKFVPYLKESKVIERFSPDELVGYQRISAPLTEDRDTYFRVRLTRGSSATGGIFKDEWVAVPTYRPENKGVIRMQVSEGSWTLEPIADGKRTHATYTVLSSPGGAIPKWLVDMSGRTAITGLFKALRDHLKK